MNPFWHRNISPKARRSGIAFSIFFSIGLFVTIAAYASAI